MWTSLNKKILYLFISIFVIGVIIGLLFMFFLSEDNKEVVFLNVNDVIMNTGINRINNIVEHLIILSSISVLSILLIGVPIYLFFVFYNGFSVGFIMYTFWTIFGIKGLLFSFIYIIITKGIFLIILFILGISLIKMSKYILDYIINRQDINDNSYFHFKKVLLCIIVVLINDIILYFAGTYLINIFQFLLN